MLKYSFTMLNKVVSDISASLNYSKERMDKHSNMYAYNFRK